MDDKYQRSNVQRFYDSVEMPGGYPHRIVETLRTIDLYYNSKFKTGDRDRKGYKKFFYNIVKPACDIATKFVDLDTKDILLLPEAPGHELKVWMMQRKLRQWLKDNHFGSLLNDIAVDFPKYGSVVLKRTKDGMKKVNLQNLRFDPAVKCLDESEFVYELSTMSRRAIQMMKEWDKDAVEELFSRGDDQTFIVYDCYDQNVDGWEHCVKADLFTVKKGKGTNRGTESEINRQGDEYFGSVCLFEEDLDDIPYRELHWERVPGRWMGYGFVEYLEENQIATNETENLDRKGLHHKALQLWQTRDESIGGSNVFSDAENGDIIRVESEITPIAKDNSDLAALGASRNVWGANTERKTFTTDITTGANLPSRTPLGVANLQASLATSYFDLKRENFGLFLKDLILEDIIPGFKNESRKAHTLTFTGSDDELDKLDRTVADIKVDSAVADYALKTGFFPSQPQRDLLRAQIMDALKSKRYRFVQVPDRFYEDAKYILDVNVTNESVDNGTKSQVLNLALQTIGTNPTVLQNPVTKAVFFQILALGGISPVDLGLLNEEASQPQTPQMPGQEMQQAGSMARPPAPVSGMMPQTTAVQ